MWRNSIIEPRLSDFAMFIDEETTPLNNSRCAIYQYQEKKQIYEWLKNGYISDKDWD